MLSEKMNNNGETLSVLSHESHVSKILRFGEDRHVGAERQMDCSNVQNLLVGHVGDSSSTKALDSQGKGHEGPGSEPNNN